MAIDVRQCYYTADGELISDPHCQTCAANDDMVAAKESEARAWVRALIGTCIFIAGFTAGMLWMWASGLMA